MITQLTFTTDEYLPKDAEMFEGTHKTFIQELIKRAYGDDTDCGDSYRVLEKLFNIRAEWNTRTDEYLSVTDGYGQDIESKLSDYGHDVLHGGV
tara:strand:+ start:1899 stop:2180 length:282 start_codon:yes stop_codon:yes gene_type:complete